MSSLMEEIKTSRREIKTDSYDISIGELLCMFQNGDIVLKPEYQRLYRWDTEQKVRFIESILIGIPIPTLYVTQATDWKWHIVSDIQRISTLLELTGHLPRKENEHLVLQETKRLPSLQNMTWETMPVDTRRLLKRARIHVIIIVTESIHLHHELSYRLNTPSIQEPYYT